MNYYEVIDLSDKNLVSLPELSEKVESFSCHQNLLTSLKGGPVVCLDYYICSRNKLINLKYAPKKLAVYLIVNQILLLH